LGATGAGLVWALPPVPEPLQRPGQLRGQSLIGIAEGMRTITLDIESSHNVPARNDWRNQFRAGRLLVGQIAGIPANIVAADTGSGTGAAPVRPSEAENTRWAGGPGPLHASFSTQLSPTL
jgi:hypothetical protein